MRKEDEKKPPGVTRTKEPAEPTPKKDLVEEADEESFPASDPPSFNPGHAGGPSR